MERFDVSQGLFGKKRESNSYYCTFSEQKYNAVHKVFVLSGATEIANIKKNKDIMLVDDLRGDELWGMHQLIQRNISHSRVDEIVSGYLNNSTKAVKFFPSITVVLIPKEGNKPGNKYKNDVASNLCIDGIAVSHPGVEDSTKLYHNAPVTLRWDKDKISAVVVDGQHRVEALRKFYHGDGSEGESSISVSFVIFENSVDLPVVDATRQLFIDVNNTPKRVSEQKLIFIDDRNLLRRLTARTLGALGPGVDIEDPYQELHKRSAFDFSKSGHISKYIIGEDGSDDENINIIFRSHESLFPWEVSHILTLHESIIQSIVLSEREAIDGSASLIKACRIINPNLLDSILDDASSELFSDKDSLSDFLREEGLEAGEREAFLRLSELRSRYIESVNEVSESGESKRERDDKVREIKAQYTSKYESMKAFDFSVVNTTSMADSSISSVCNLVASVINGLWFVREIQNLLENGVDEFGPEDVYKFVIVSKEKYSSWSGAGSHKIRRARDEYISMNDFAESKSHALRQFIQKLEELTSGNILRSLVGQQALFGFLISQDRAHDADLSYLKERLGDLMQPLNNLGESGYFDVDKKIKFEIVGHEMELSPWEGLIVKGKAMSPGPNSAGKASKLLKLVCSGVRVRSDTTKKRVGVSEYNSVIMSYGTRIFENLNESMHIDKIWEGLRKRNHEAYLTENESMSFCLDDFPDPESPTYVRLVKKVLGGKFMEIVYDELSPVMRC